jgi:anthranilate synthase component 2
MDEVYHGVATEMEVIISNAIIFKNIPVKFKAARYHSWIASNDDFPNELEITSEDEEGGIMAIRHRDFPISAVQFHPESILTEVGEQLVKNFIDANKI